MAANEPPRFRVGDSVWFVGRLGVIAGEVHAGVVTDVLPGTWVEPRVMYTVQFDSTRDGRKQRDTMTVPVYDVVWRWLFESEAGARHQYALLTLMRREHWAGPDQVQRRVWFYALDAATRAMRTQKTECR